MKKKNPAGFIISLVITVIALFGLVLQAVDGFASGEINIETIIAIVNITILVLSAVYLIADYKNPHGNLLKLLMLLFAFALVYTGMCATLSGDAVSAVLIFISVVLISYMSGRLDRLEKNKALCFIILLLLAGFRVSLFFNYKIDFDLLAIPNMICRTATLLGWLNLCIIYATRFAEHKSAGEKTLEAEIPEAEGNETEITALEASENISENDNAASANTESDNA